MARTKSPQSLDSKVLRRMRAGKSGSVFTPVQFLDFGTRAGVDQALSRLAREGRIERAGRGLYFLPRSHPRFGRLGANPEEVVKTIAWRDRLRVQEGGAYAANSMGLTEQVPARIIYDTDGRSRKVKVGGRTVIEFKHRSPRRMAGAGCVTGMVISALANIGRVHVTPQRLSRMRHELKPEHKRQLLEDLALAPAWMHKHLRYIAGEEAGK